MPFGSSGNIYLMGAIGQGLGPVFLTPILTRALDSKSYGEITFITSFAAILGILFSLGLPIVISRTYVLDETSRTSIIKWFKNIIFIYIAASVLLLFFVDTSIGLAVVSLAFPFALMQLILPLARAQDKAKSFAMISIIGTLSPSLGVITNSYLDNSVTNSKALIIGALIGSIFSSLLLEPKLEAGKLLAKFSFLRSVKVAYPILPHMFAMMALLNIDKVIFGSQLDKSITGYLQVIMLIGTAPIMILSALNHAWLNQILLKLKNNSNKAFKELNITIFKLLVLAIILIFFIIFFSNILIKFLNLNIILTTEIQKTIILTAISSLIYVVYLANTHLLTWQNKFWVLGVTTPLSVIVQSIVIYLAIDSFGYLSAALGLGSALSLQVLLLEWIRSKTETKKAIHLKYLAISLSAFWSTALLFLN
jgi:O-antigen/teichoic acid export membrane protein